MGVTEPILISIIVPVYNEAGNIFPLYQRTLDTLRDLGPDYDYEFVFTDNHSVDETFAELRQLAQQDSKVRVTRFSRNFGFQNSILKGYLSARGQVAVQLDCDLQDPPEMIPQFLEAWRQGYKVVYGVRRSRPEGWLLQQGRRVFYRLINWLSEDELPHDAGDFRLVDRVILDQLKEFNDQQPYLRGAIASLGFRQCGLTYDRQARERGESKFPLRKLVSLALDGILNHSIVPLRMALATGILMSIFSAVGIFVYAFSRLVLGQDWPAGFATTTLLQFLSIGLNSIFLGVIGEYVGRIYRQVKVRPLVVIECEIN